jgi:hypothetical protein
LKDFEERACRVYTPNSQRRAEKTKKAPTTKTRPEIIALENPPLSSAIIWRLFLSPRKKDLEERALPVGV